MSQRLSPYTPISEIKKMREGSRVAINLFAKIAEAGIPRMTKGIGTDYYIGFKLADGSCQFGVSITIFAPTVADLPRIHSVGDIICLHNVEVKVYKGESGESIFCSFNKRKSSYAFFDKEGSTGVIPYKISASFRATNYVSKYLDQLRSLSLEHYQPDANRQQDAIVSLLLLKELEEGKVCDILCQVVHVCRIPSGDGLILYVWDGTDTAPVTFKSNLNIEESTPTPMQPESSPLSSEILSSFPRIGTVLRVIAPNDFEHIFDVPGREQWIKFCNVTCELRSEIMIGVMNADSKVFILSDEYQNVKHRERIYNERKASDLGQIPLTCSLQTSHVTVTDYETVPYSTLMESIYSEELLSSKCVVRVVASLPWRGEHLHSVNRSVRARLTLEDPTARLHAYIYEEDWVQFIGPDTGADDITRKMMKLLGIRNPPTGEKEMALRNPPWVKCCLRKFHRDENDKVGTMRFQIFGTRLIGDAVNDQAQGEGGAQVEVTEGVTADRPIIID
ncbi:uncharacterized protein A4U43_C08F36060 [Asparagus officinalis]|uniref:protection of telomeres protein 1a-like n=1 Tax=Asparagus officinalis TaxID=4686 RepID=UPI00098DFBDF|nr:protection of telomeres protein 1a-like [Asparagus officinalis]ONK62029.1 uncharacterized protein A4U43_C08F36060 [Asparagus officinalis]